MNNRFERTEKKYVITDEKYEILKQEIAPYMERDQYGRHTICNVYYDTEQNDLIRRSIEKPKYKEKFRVRSYGIPEEKDLVFMEIKKKWKGIVYKRRISLPYENIRRYLQEGILPELAENQKQIFNEIDYMIRFYHLQPAIYLAYEREAYIGIEDVGIRLTVDKNIRSRRTDLELIKGDAGEKLLPEGMCLLEIKVPFAIPLWLSEILNRLKIYPSSFSKYGNIYKKEHDVFVLKIDECEDEEDV